MKFLYPEDEKKELTFQDVFLMPQYSDISSRMDVDLTPVSSQGMTIPLVVANMTAVAGRRMAETVTRRGGLVVLTQDMSLERIEEIVRYIRSCHHVYESPVVLSEKESVQTALNLINKRSHGTIVVVNDQYLPVGIFTEKDALDRDRYCRLRDVMTHKVITVSDGLGPEEIFHLLNERHISIVPVIGQDGKLKGVMSKKGAVRATVYRPALNASGKFLTAAAVRISENVESAVKRLLEIGIDLLVMDTAHGHQKRMLDAIRIVRGIVGPDYPLAAGNIVSASAAVDLIDAGASIVKVGVGPGGACTTRMMTGVGRPQFSAVREVAQVAREHGADVWADGGIRHPRDVALALSAGAHCCMVGSWFAGTYESPADVQFDEHGRMYKEQFGMASHRAVIDRTRSEESFTKARKEFFKEGISHSRMYLKEHQESVEDIIDLITAGLRSACTYSGARNLDELHNKAIVGVQSFSGFEEGKPVKESWS